MIIAVITTLTTLILGAYGFIFRSVLKRIENIESKQEKADPILLKIQTSLAKIETDIEWIKQNNK